MSSEDQRSLEELEEVILKSKALLKRMELQAEELAKNIKINQQIVKKIKKVYSDD